MRSVGVNASLPSGLCILVPHGLTVTWTADAILFARFVEKGALGEARFCGGLPHDQRPQIDERPQTHENLSGFHDC